MALVLVAELETDVGSVLQSSSWPVVVAVELEPVAGWRRVLLPQMDLSSSISSGLLLDPLEAELVPQ